MEIRGLGILNITHLFGVAAVRDNKKIEVVVELSEAQEEDYDRLGTEPQVWPILGVDVPLARIPLRPGRNIASLIEVVAPQPGAEVPRPRLGARVPGEDQRPDRRQRSRRQHPLARLRRPRADPARQLRRRAGPEVE